MSKITIEKVKLADIRPYEKNPRKISKVELDKLKKSLNDFPDMLKVREIVVDENNVILGGNQRYKGLLANGQSETMVKRVVGWTEEEKREFVIKDNIMNGEWDMDAVGRYFGDLPLQEWGLNEYQPTIQIIEDEPPAIDQENTYSEAGKIYCLGNHRIFCGSFSDFDMDSLFGKDYPVCTFTDPPYNVAVKSRSTGKTIQNDNMEHSEFQKFLNEAFQCVASCMPNGGGVISWMSDVEILTLKQAMDNAGLNFKTMICWVKNQFTLGGGDFQSAKEVAIYSLGEGSYEKIDDDTDDSQYACYSRNGGKFTDSRKLSNVWFFDKPKSNKDHPTMKPIGLCAKGILAMSEPGDTVFDPFLGSGSTLIAAEQVGRRCCGCELDPKYCDVVRKRYWIFTTGSEDGWQKGTENA